MELSTEQWIELSIEFSLELSIDLSTELSTNRVINQSIYQSIDVINRVINQTIYQSIDVINRVINQSSYKLIELSFFLCFFSDRWRRWVIRLRGQPGDPEPACGRDDVHNHNLHRKDVSTDQWQLLQDWRRTGGWVLSLTAEHSIRSVGDDVRFWMIDWLIGLIVWLVDLIGWFYD